MWKNYKAIFFDWDGTAVMSRKAPVDEAVEAMKPLLQKGVKLAIISGTTIENIAGGKLESYFTRVISPRKSLIIFILDWDVEPIIIPFMMGNRIFLKIWCRRKRNF